TEFKVTLYATKTHEISLDHSPTKLINYLKKKKQISTKEAAVFLAIAPRNARIKLKNLLNSGIIQKIGTSAKDPHSFYVLTRSFK
ncbi:MAG: hypothetical protein V1855_03290, partial [bacterium]